MEYERDNYANMQNQQQQQQQQQHELQHKLQLQQHQQHLDQQQQQQQQLQQQQPQPQQQQPQPQQPHLHMHPDYHQVHHQHLQQQMHQHHLYMQHQHHQQQQQQQHQQNVEQQLQQHAQLQQQQQQHAQLQQQHQQHQQQMLLHQQEMFRLHVEHQQHQQQQQQQQQLNPAITTTMPNYANTNSISTTAATTNTNTTALNEQQQQQQQTHHPHQLQHPTQPQQTNVVGTSTITVSPTDTTKTTTVPPPPLTTTSALQSNVDYAALQQQQQHHQHQQQQLQQQHSQQQQQQQQQHAYVTNNNKTDTSITAYTNNSNNSNNNISNNNINNSNTNHMNHMPHIANKNLDNGSENTQMDYNKYYQQFLLNAQQQQHQPPPALPPPPLINSYAVEPPPISTTTSPTTTTIPATTHQNITTTTAAATTTPSTTQTTKIEATTTTETTTNESEQNLNNNCMKRKFDNENDDTTDNKKALDEKINLISHLRKNIRDVMDGTQLDMTTLAAQREESERLARVAEQQKAMREYQRQTAVNRQFVRTQNRVMSLLQSGKTYAKFTEEPTGLECDETIKKEIELKQPKLEILDENDETNNKIELRHVHDEEELTKSPHSSKTENEQATPTADVVTIEDSSSEDDCILLSDDDDEELMDEDAEDDPHNSGLHVQDSYNVPDEFGRVVINVGHPEGEEDIYVAPQIAKTIKPHQIGGVRFLFDNIIESTKRFKNSSGFGCILAHSMGLGKTLQVVCFCDIFLRHTNSKTVLCVMPINTLQNWVNEFNMWTPRHSTDPNVVRPRNFDVFVLNDQHKTLSARAKVILRWAEEGGVLLIGYELFRLLAMKIMPQRRRRGKQLNTENTSSDAHKRLTESIYQALVKPGPDLVICDEGHRIKNAHAGISLALKQIRTRRRIVLTGYPLQNNLLEYWCMVDFVRPNYLGTRTEFCNMFERPIQNGQCIDSTPEDIKLMRYRAHVLHSLLVGFVQRRSHMVLQQTLPKKLEYVILTEMTAFQRQLYETFMNDVVRTRTVPNPLKAFSVCCKIWNHPDVLYNFLKRYEHDLDIEIEEGEIVPETPPTPTTAITTLPLTTTTPTASVSTASSETQAESVATPNSIVSATLVDESQTSSSGFSSMTAPTPTPTVTNTETTSSNNTNNNTNNKPVGNTNENFDNLTYAATQNMNNNNGNVGGNNTTADCNGNNYWLEPNLPYYTPYPTVLPSQHVVQQPDYVGIVVKQNGGVAGENAHTSSSEIVDLDTKEIKTVETDIDMERNTVIKTEGTITTTSTTTTSKTTTTKSQLDKSPDDNYKSVERESTRWADGVPYDWALDLMKKYEPDLIKNSPKMEIFFCILQESIKINDRVLLFSQSLLTLNLIERFLQANFVPGSENYWSRNTTYFRLDGSTNSQEREKLVTEFNTNHNVKLFLISTRAGSLGINLVGANRVIVFDASWNPCHDTQAVYRIYRYGQQKACYVYRIVMDRCLEKKIYDRQIKKQGMSDRVVDECNPDAHLSLKDVTNLCHDYDDDNKIKTDEEKFKTSIENYLDDVIKTVITDYKTCLSKEPFFHESLLIDRKEKKLSQAEKRQAHRGYEMEKKASSRQTVAYTGTPANKVQYRVVRNDGVSITRPVNTRNNNVRATRWIPAEVWQRQGMTAQEMTLPLDVVIPTNSSDKTSIILKAGQRVMVLKSAKGIYMQLESGKIIAIRTSKNADSGATGAASTTNAVSTNSATTATTSKAVEGKTNEIIDITADGDNASNQTSSSSSSNNSTISNNNNNNNNATANPQTKTINNYNYINNNSNSLLITNNAAHATTTNLLLQKDVKLKNDAYLNNGTIYDAKEMNKNLQKTTKDMNKFSHIMKSPTSTNTANTMSQRKKATPKIEITSNERLPPIKPFNANMFNVNQITTTTNNNVTDNINETEQKFNPNRTTPQQNNEQQKQQKQKLHQQNAVYGNNQHHYIHHHQQQHHQQPQQQPPPPPSPTIYSNKPTHENLLNYAQPTTPEVSASTTKKTTQNNDMQNKDAIPLNATSPKNKLKNMTKECFQNTNIYMNKSHIDNEQQQLCKNELDAVTTVTTTGTTTTNQHVGKVNNEYLTTATLPPTATPQHLVPGNSNYATYGTAAPANVAPPPPTAAPTSLPAQPQQQQQTQQQAGKMRLYMPQYGLPHASYGSTAAAPPSATTSTAAAAQLAPTAAVLPGNYAKSVPNYTQYYESMYDCSNGMAAVEYPTVQPPTHPPPPAPTAYTDYTAAYATPYHTNFQPNSYACGTFTSPVRSAASYMHWSPLVTSASLAEHHAAAANSMFSTANYANDAAAAAASAAAQANPWHHQ